MNRAAFEKRTRPANSALQVASVGSAATANIQRARATAATRAAKSATGAAAAVPTYSPVHRAQTGS